MKLAVDAIAMVEQAFWLTKENKTSLSNISRFDFRAVLRMLSKLGRR
jgi:hypothetical protein